MEEVAAVPRLVNGPCLLNVVRGGKTPDLDLGEAERMGYKLAIVPGLLLKSVIGICEQMLAELKATQRHPALVKEMTVREVFQMSGADEWDALRTPLPRPGAEARRGGVRSSGASAASSRRMSETALRAPVRYEFRRTGGRPAGTHGRTRARPHRHGGFAGHRRAYRRAARLRRQPDLCGIAARECWSGRTLAIHHAARRGRLRGRCWRRLDHAGDLA